MHRVLIMQRNHVSTICTICRWVRCIAIHTRSRLTPHWPEGRWCPPQAACRRCPRERAQSPARRVPPARRPPEQQARQAPARPASARAQGPARGRRPSLAEAWRCRCWPPVVARPAGAPGSRAQLRAHAWSAARRVIDKPSTKTSNAENRCSLRMHAASLPPGAPPARGAPRRHARPLDPTDPAGPTLDQRMRVSVNVCSGCA